MENESNQAVTTRAVQVAMAVSDAILSGKTLAKALKEMRLDMHAFYRLMSEDKNAAQLYARAQEFRADVLVDEALEIADTEGDSGVARNRIDIRKWTASRLNAKRWGDRIDLNVSQTLDIAGTLALAQQRLRPAHDLLEHSPAQVIDSIAVSIPEPLDKQSNSAPVAVQVPDIFD